MSWQCPYCQSFATLQGADRTMQSVYLHGPSQNEPGHELVVISTRCPNPKCRQVSIQAHLFELARKGNDAVRAGVIERWSLLPRSSEKPQPDYIPAPIRQDYSEACQIRDLSPKASATLSRRCLQGMIRDFCRISRKRLVDEIEALRQAVNDGRAPRGVEVDTVDAIDHVRTIGNIGAHMEADINVIVDVDPNEAQTLIELIELLFDEWYVAREKRAMKLEALGLMAASKRQLKADSAPKALPAPDSSKAP